MKKVVQCTTGGYVKLQSSLLNQYDLGCQSCLELVEGFGFEHKELEKVVIEFLNVPAEEQDGQELGEESGEKSHRWNAPDRAAPPSVIWEWVESLKPALVLLPHGSFGKKVPYQCKLCTTKRWPEGRVGDCTTSKAKDVLHFILQHLDSEAHRRNFIRKESPELLQKVPCEGLCVGDPSAGHLYVFREEFAIWASMANFSEFAQHTYWKSGNEEMWFLRSSACSKECEFIAGQQRHMCPHCIELGSSRQVVRCAVRFAEKHWAAKLLSARIFQGKDGANEVIRSLKETAPRINSLFHCFSTSFSLGATITLVSISFPFVDLYASVRFILIHYASTYRYLNVFDDT